MPTISMFFGILIRMYYDNHNPPHFHAIYGKYEAQITIDTLDVIQGTLPRRALAMTIEWAQQHKDELRHDWKMAELHHPLIKIRPLE